MEQEQPHKKLKKRKSSCVGCGGSIMDQFIMRVAPDLEWHASCLKCAECSCHLDESCTCFVREGKTYCKRDYLRLFGARCSKCSQGFSKNDFVMRARNKIYHIDCFRCVACSRQLIPGDEFALRDDGLFCKADNDVVERSSNNNNSLSGEDLEDSKDNIITTLSDSKSGENSPELPSKNGSSERGSGHSRKEKAHKTTRVRTVLNEKQLHTLRTCYNANPRPDALMKEQLTEMTSLSPRVIRVWFQNKRCKDKKRSIFLKQMQQQQHEKCPSPYILQQGVPMVASSPVRHEPPPNMQQHPIDVQSYQAPWKALSEFAMGPGDMEHPGQAPFQQLISQFDKPDAMGLGPMPGEYGPPPGNMTYTSMMEEFRRSNSVSSGFSHQESPSELSSPQSSV